MSCIKRFPSPSFDGTSGEKRQKLDSASEILRVAMVNESALGANSPISIDVRPSGDLIEVTNEEFHGGSMEGISVNDGVVFHGSDRDGRNVSDEPAKFSAKEDNKTHYDKDNVPPSISGCTCGKCLGGFLSPRTHFILLGQAEILHDIISTELDEPVSNSVHDHWEFTHANDMWEHLPQACRRNMMTNKSMRQGHCNVIGYVAECLRANRLPTVGNILQASRIASEWPPYTRSYLDRGAAVGISESALIEAVLHGVCDSAAQRTTRLGMGASWNHFVVIFRSWASAIMITHMAWSGTARRVFNH